MAIYPGKSRTLAVISACILLLILLISTCLILENINKRNSNSASGADSETGSSALTESTSRLSPAATDETSSGATTSGGTTQDEASSKDTGENSQELTGEISSGSSAKPDPDELIKLYPMKANSASISVPDGWNVSSLGSPGNLLAYDEDGSRGFVFQFTEIFPPKLSDSADGHPVSSYKNPVDYLKEIFLPGLLNNFTGILKQTDASTLMAAPKAAEAQAIILSAENQKGLKLKYFIICITIKPAAANDKWHTLAYGFWTSENPHDSRYTLVTRVASSYKPDRDTIKNEIATLFRGYNGSTESITGSFLKQLKSMSGRLPD